MLNNLYCKASTQTSVSTHGSICFDFILSWEKHLSADVISAYAHFDEVGDPTASSFPISLPRAGTVCNGE